MARPSLALMPYSSTTCSLVGALGRLDHRRVLAQLGDHRDRPHGQDRHHEGHGGGIAGRQPQPGHHQDEPGPLQHEDVAGEEPDDHPQGEHEEQPDRVDDEQGAHDGGLAATALEAVVEGPVVAGDARGGREVQVGLARVQQAQHEHRDRDLGHVQERDEEPVPLAQLHAHRRGAHRVAGERHPVAHLGDDVRHVHGAIDPPGDEARERDGAQQVAHGNGRQGDQGVHGSGILHGGSLRRAARIPDTTAGGEGGIRTHGACARRFSRALP